MAYQKDGKWVYEKGDQVRTFENETIYTVKRFFEPPENFPLPSLMTLEGVRGTVDSDKFQLVMWRSMSGAVGCLPDHVDLHQTEEDAINTLLSLHEIDSDRIEVKLNDDRGRTFWASLYHDEETGEHWVREHYVALVTSRAIHRRTVKRHWTYQPWGHRGPPITPDDWEELYAPDVENGRYEIKKDSALVLRRDLVKGGIVYTVSLGGEYFADYLQIEAVSHFSDEEIKEMRE